MDKARVGGRTGDILLFDECCVGWKVAVDFDGCGGANSGFGYSLGLGGDFSTNAEGDLDTTFTQDEFDINANSGGNGNDWFRANYDSKSKSLSDTTDGGWTRHSESKSTVHEDVKQESDGNSSFTFELSKPTAGDASGSVALTFGGGSGDEWHVLDESDGEWEDNYDNGSGSTEINQGTSKSKYKMDDVYNSSYGGDPSASLSSDGSVTASGSSHADEDYTFDQVSESENKWSEETSYTGGYEGYTWTECDTFCDLNSVKQPEVLEHIITAVESWLMNPKVVQRLRAELHKQVATKATKATPERLTKQLATLEGKLTKAKRRLLECDSDMLPEVQQGIRDLRAEQTRLEAALEAARTPQDDLTAEQDERIDKALAAFSTLRKTLAEADPVLLRQLLRETVGLSH